MTAPRILQIVLGSDDLPFCKHLYTAAFGFAGAGERLIYSEHNGRVMGLGGWGGATVLYMVGRQELVQLEFWTHTTPPQKPLPTDWRPDDLGFCRLGVSVPAFDATLERLAALNCPALTAPIEVDGLRRVCFRDPTIGIPVEIMEEGEALPGTRDRYHALEPAVVYVAVSVADADAAVAYWRGVVGLDRVAVELHAPQHEALWRSSHAPRKTAMLRGGTIFLEIVEYDKPAGRRRHSDDALRRQGFKTIAVGCRDPAETGAIFHRVKAAGLNWTVEAPASFIGGNHVIGAVAQHMKTLSVPHELERQFGYAPDPGKWWRPSPQAEIKPQP